MPQMGQISREWLLRNARIPGYDGLQQVLLQDGVVSQVECSGNAPNTERQLDLLGDWLSLGGVDLQINGALGLAFPELTEANVDRLTEIGDWLWAAGVDAYCPTIVTTSISNIQRSLGLIRQFTVESSQTAKIIGVHLEGPCLNFEKRGAHPAEFLQPLTIEVMQQVLGDYSDIVSIITLAPELDPSGAVVEYLRQQGITVSLGHSQATAETANQAFAAGATMVTHAFNAMPSLHHRQPGLLGAAIVHPQVRCGFIADGEHISQIMLQLLLNASGDRQGLFLVSDALSPLGLPDGRYPWDSRAINVTQGTARLDDGTLSGTTLSLLQGVQNLVGWGLCSIATGIRLATSAPRHAIGQSSEIIGQPIEQLLRWHTEETRDQTSIKGWERLNLPTD
ncbi:N-acetylglucosamine-6-phosphate deacetylase [filamentous cyanobacterium LEGE 11480]|uniref:N-acetylglucosamine-6-phosphate deacetylase n=1 Tax=Romeriopsis navalis LEGE 11480 TaxID=2777977 RepID=A0A928VPT7_9CYAN|nr:N-acetylglucosamine-6-phosphate deacetylase [Romeriopsis navalis]MBE9032466.1 N-acetylglucosamine-6-phosphate deacetylase [Romeriopsis navalis LEGE 11480]